MACFAPIISPSSLAPATQGQAYSQNLTTSVPTSFRWNVVERKIIYTVVLGSFQGDEIVVFSGGGSARVLGGGLNFGVNFVYIDNVVGNTTGTMTGTGGGIGTVTSVIVYNFPPGLALTSAGDENANIGGVPTSSGVFNFAVSAKVLLDPVTCPAGVREYTLEIVPAVVIPSGGSGGGAGFFPSEFYKIIKTLYPEGAPEVVKIRGTIYYYMNQSDEVYYYYTKNPPSEQGRKSNSIIGSSF